MEIKLLLAGTIKHKKEGEMFKKSCRYPIYRVFLVTQLIGLLLILCENGSAREEEISAGAGEFELGGIVVTAKKGYERNAMSIPANITVITSEDIARSNARTVADLLRSEAGLVVRDMYGNGGQASVDIRGFGEAASMNCVILIDGRRVNPIDMANPDLTQVSLAQVERIEVLRGGAGVLYGDNATGGVINIITKKPEKAKLNVSASYNAFNGTDLRFGLGNVTEKYFYSINGGLRFSQGYRQHSEMSAGDVGIRIGKEENNGVPGWDLSAGFYTGNYQFPGPIDQQDWDSGYCQRSYIWGGSPYGPIKSTVPLDNGGTTDWYSRLAMEKSISGFKTETEISLRNRNAKSFMDSWGSYGSRYTRVLGAGEKVSRNLSGVDLLAGVEYYSNSYNISPESRTGNPTPANDDQRFQRSSTAAYIQIVAPLLHILCLEAGGRIENANQHFEMEDPVTSSTHETLTIEILDALYAGLSVKVAEGINVYARWAKSYRLPVTDEYCISPIVARGIPGKFLSLKPQKNQDIECGLKYAREKIGVNFSLFLTRTTDELYPNPIIWENANYPDPTLRMGGELQVSLQLFNFASISCGYTFTDARFDTGGSGVYAGKEIPLVPRHKGDIKLRVNLPLDINLGVDCTMVSDRWFGSDYTQTGNKLPGYTVVDLNFSRQFENLRLFGAVTNIGNVKYAETAFAGTYYPSPVRNFVLGMDINL